MPKHIFFINCTEQQNLFSIKIETVVLDFKLRLSLTSEIEFNVFIFLIYISNQHHAEWSGIGTFSVKEGCQWVKEPVSRHFFINQNRLRI
jgi:hypothetical protein